VGVADALLSLGMENVSLKWPNDLLLDGAKVGGILVELAGITHPLMVVVGVGINVGGGPEIRDRLGISIGDVHDVYDHISRNELAARLVESIYRSIVRFEVEGFAMLRERWHQLHAHRDLPVVVRTANESIEGIARGVTLAGELMLETTRGIRHFSGGEVSLRAAGVVD